MVSKLRASYATKSASMRIVHSVSDLFSSSISTQDCSKVYITFAKIALTGRFEEHNHT